MERLQNKGDTVVSGRRRLPKRDRGRKTDIRDEHTGSLLIPNLLGHPIQPLLYDYTSERGPGCVWIEDARGGVDDGLAVRVAGVRGEERRKVRQVGEDVGVWERENRKKLFDGGVGEPSAREIKGGRPGSKQVDD